MGAQRTNLGFALTRGFPHHMGWRLVDLAVVQENGLEAATAASLLISEEEGVTLGRENTRHHSGQVYLTNPKYPGQVVIDQRVSREACVVKQSVGCVELRHLAKHPLVVRRAGGAAEEVEVVTQGTVMMHDGDSLWLVSARAFSVHVTGLGFFDAAGGCGLHARPSRGLRLCVGVVILACGCARWDAAEGGRKPRASGRASARLCGSTNGGRATLAARA